MTMKKRILPGLGAIALYALSSAAMLPNARADGIGATGGTGGFGSTGSIGRLSGRGARAGSLRGGSLINHGGAGYSIYSQRGVTRTMTPPAASGKIYHPGGTSTLVIGDGAGGAHVYGPGVTHRVFGDAPVLRGPDK